MKVIIAGSRQFNDKSLLFAKCDSILANSTNITVVSGHAAGADALGEVYAQAHGYPVEVYPADWNADGKSAGFKRNVRMAMAADAAICFWDGESPGTQHLFQTMRRLKKPVRIIR